MPGIKTENTDVKVLVENWDCLPEKSNGDFISFFLIVMCTKRVEQSTHDLKSLLMQNKTGPCSFEHSECSCFGLDEKRTVFGDFVVEQPLCDQVGLELFVEQPNDAPALQNVT